LEAASPEEIDKTLFAAGFPDGIFEERQTTLDELSLIYANLAQVAE
jgi:hypothetical protein